MLAQKPVDEPTIRLHRAGRRPSPGLEARGAGGREALRAPCGVTRPQRACWAPHGRWRSRARLLCPHGGLLQGMQNSKPPLTGAKKSNGPRGSHPSREGPASPAGGCGCRATWAAGPKDGLGYISGVYATAQDAQEKPRGLGRGPCRQGSKSCGLSRAHRRRNPGPGSACPAQAHGMRSECPSRATGILHQPGKAQTGCPSVFRLKYVKVHFVSKKNSLDSNVKTCQMK